MVSRDAFSQDHPQSLGRLLRLEAASNPSGERMGCPWRMSVSDTVGDYLGRSEVLSMANLVGMEWQGLRQPPTEP